MDFTKISAPAPFKIQRLEAAMSWVHYKGYPYPYAGFATVSRSKEGPYPASLPITPNTINYLSNSLFSVPPIFRFNGEESIASYLQCIYTNVIEPKLFKIRDMGGVFGNVFAKITYDENLTPELQLYDCRNFYITHTAEGETLVLRFPFHDGDKNYWFTEVWTKETVYEFEPQEIPGEGLEFHYAGIPFMYIPAIEGQFVGPLSSSRVKTTRKNPFNGLPGVLFSNKDDLNPYDTGDIFDIRHIIRRLDLVYHLMDVSNTREAFPTAVFLNAIDDTEENVGVEPGDAVYIQSAENPDGSERKADVKLLEASGSMRTHMTHYAESLRQMFYDHFGVVFTSPDSDAKKGSAREIYAPTQTAINRYRAQYGINGIIPLLYKILIGSSDKRLNGKGKLAYYDFLSACGPLKWFNHIKLTEEEKLYAADRLIRLSDMGLIPVEEAIRKIAELEQLNNVDDWIEDQTSLYEEKAEKREKIEENGNNDKGKSNEATKSAKPRTETADNHD